MQEGAVEREPVGSRWIELVIGPAAAIVAVVLATVALRSADAELGAAVLVYLLVVTISARVGVATDVAAVAASCVALNLCFVAPVGELELLKSSNVAPFLAFAFAGFVCGSQPRDDSGPIIALVIVAGLTATLLAADADLVVAATTYTGLVVVVALMGPASATVAVVSAYISLNFWFTFPFDSLEINKFDDLVPLIMFVLVAVVSAGTVARIDGLRQRQREIEQAAFEAQVSSAVNESRAAFLAAMTHNLRTPLATIKTTVAAVAATPEVRGDDAAIKLLVTADEEVDRLERLVTKVLELARIHANALEPRTEPTDVGELARVAARRLRHVAHHHDLRLAVEGELLIVDVDPGMIELVLVIALENAVRFAPVGSEILVSAREAADRRCEVRIVDHGPGIAPHDRERVFEEFVRLDPRSQGSGLGLAIARAFVEAHGGSIWAEPTPGGGATIAFSLPREDDQ